MKHIKTGKERTKEDLSALRKTVSEIIEDVVANGDAALRSYSEKFDGFARPVFRVSREEIDDAYSHVSEQELNDMKSALANIRTFAEAQRATIHDLPEFQPRPGILLGHRVIPVQSCCCYVPGGRFPLYSSAMMLITPAKVAGVKRIVTCWTKHLSPWISPARTKSTLSAACRPLQRSPMVPRAFFRST